MISFVVFGIPQPQGSARAFLPKGWKRPVITADNARLKPWRQQVSAMAMLAMKESGCSIIERNEPVKLVATFFFDKPRSEKKLARYKAKKPDLDKLLRGLADGLTGIVFRDDAQLCAVEARKLFDAPARVLVEVERL